MLDENKIINIESIQISRNDKLDININDFTEIFYHLNLSIMTIGIIGNAFCIFIFLKRNVLAQKFKYYLMILALCELIFCIILFLDYLFRYIHPDHILLHQFNKILTILFDYLVHTLDAFLCVITLTLSIDRLYAIRNPLKIKLFITNLHSKFLTIIIFVSVTILKVPTVTLCNHNDNDHGLVSYCSLLTPVIFNILPIILVLITNVFLIKDLIINFRNKSKPKNFRNQACSKSQIETSMSCSQDVINVTLNTIRIKPVKFNKKTHYISIIILSLWSVSTAIPYYIFNTYDLIYRLNLFDFESIDRVEVVERIKTFSKIQIVTSFLFNLSHCINFFVYICFYPLFRIYFIGIFRKRLLSKFCNK
jgi:hypothetical protein